MPSMAAAFVLAAALVAGAQPGSAPAPPLPSINLAALPSAAAKAIAEAYSAAQRQPNNADAAGRLAMVLHAWEDWDHAAAAYRRAQQLAPNDYRWWHLAGLVETRRGRHQDALELFQRAAALAPDRLPVRLRVAEAKLETGDLEGSERLFRELVREGATLAAAEYGVGRIAMARGDLKTALEHFDRAVGAFPDFGAAHYGRALAYRRLGRDADANDALDHHKRCLPCWPATGDDLAQSVAAVREDADAILKRAIALAREGQDREAIDAHERAIALDPSLAQARINLITLYGRIGDWTRAEAEYQAALRLQTNLADAHTNYAQVLVAQGKLADAVSHFRKGLALAPADAQAWNGLGLALERSGDSAAAADAYREATVHAPALRVARFNYARTLVAARRLTEAIVELEKLRTPTDAETPRYLFALSAALVRAGDIARGKTEATAALELARRYGQSELAATIQRDLALLR